MWRVEELNSYFHMEYVMTFLMGLNESFAHIWSQLLLLDPIPPINKVFSLLSQEERQWSITSQIASKGTELSSSMVFFTKNNNNKKYGNNLNTGSRYQKKERPFCSHCNYHGHTVDKCYKLYGYPPGYKHKQRLQSVPINQISKTDQLH